MQIWVLGTLEVTDQGRAYDVRGPLPRRLLSLLALTPRAEVSSDRLVDGLWGERPPGAAASTVQSHVARLRRDLPDPGLIRTGRQGYVLELDPGEVDAHVLEQALARGTTALLAGRHDEASTTLTEALSLWRGTPYAEFPDCGPLQEEATRLEGLRLDALERRISADLGRPGCLPPVAELEALVRWHPVRESFWALLMTALYRAGRQGDALAAYRRASATLADELGVDPGPQLQQLERLVLAQDPALESPEMSTYLPAPARRPYADPVALLERADLLETLTGLHGEALAGSGRLVLVHGEAGAGKSALVHVWGTDASSRARLLRGACDPLSSPRPLGPLVDVAHELDPLVAELLRAGEREGLFEATLAALETGGPSVLVIEDLHWADMGTLDLVRFLARRIEGTSVLVVATYRDEHLQANDPLRVMLGDITSMPVVRRVAVPLLSRAGVAELVGDIELDVDALYAETGGNPFFVTEVVQSGGEHLPATVQDAVLARVHRLSPQARLALETSAVVGSRIEPSLLHALPDVSSEAVDECVGAGMLRLEAPTYAFRHELVRQAVLSGIAPGRLGALHWQVLDRLRAMPMSPKPYARLAEHADMAGDPQAILEFAVAAGDSAARLGSHLEAAFQYGRAMPYAELLDLEPRIALLAAWAEQCHTADRLHESAEASEALVRLLRGTDRTLELGRALRRLAHTYATMGRSTDSDQALSEAIEVLETLPPGGELADAYALRAGGHMVANEYDDAIVWAERTLELADRVGSVQARAQALNTLGCSVSGQGDPAGEELLRESLRLAHEHGLDHVASRGYTNLAFVLDVERRYDEALAVLEDGIAHMRDHDQHTNMLCTMASHAWLEAELGRWDAAVRESHELIFVRETSRASRMEPLLVLAAVGARRGDRDDVHELLDTAYAVSLDARQLQYDVPVAAVRGEVHLLEGDPDTAEIVLRPAYDKAVAMNAPDFAAEVAIWLWRAGRLEEGAAVGDGPVADSIAGRPRAAAARWQEWGFPYHQAWALLDSDAEIDIREARALFDRLGAAVLVERCDARLRALGARVPRGARASTRANVGGLTDREVEVLELLDEGLRNAEIAARLHLSEKTVGHHVSSILAKLGVGSRLEAVRRARDLAAAG